MGFAQFKDVWADDLEFQTVDDQQNTHTEM